MPYGSDEDLEAFGQDLDLDLGMGPPPAPAPVSAIKDASKDQIAIELLRRGVDPTHIERAGFGHIAKQWRSGLVAMPLDAPDPVAARQAYARDYDKLSKSREVLGTKSPDMSALQRFRELNRVQRTGGIQHQTYGDSPGERFNPFNWPGMIGNAVVRYDPEFQEMSGIASILQGKARPEGSGATSDFEQRLYRMGVPSPEKPGRVNTSIIAHMKGVHAEESDRTAFEDEFIRRNGTLAGSQEAWQRYLQANPYVRTVKTPKHGAVLAENPERQSWREYFGLQAGPGAAAAAGGGVRDQVSPRLRQIASSAYAAAKPAFLRAYTQRAGSSRGAEVAFDAWWAKNGQEVVRDGLQRSQRPSGGGRGRKTVKTASGASATVEWVD